MTDIPTITALPPAPQRGQDAALFVQRADAFIDAMVALVPELNEFGDALRDEFADLSVIKFTATSTTAVTIGTGTKNFVATTNVAFTPAQTVMIASVSDPTRYMQGAITSYDATSGALVVAVTLANGTGTRSDWKIGLVPAFDIEARLAAFDATLAPTARWPAASVSEARAGTASRLISAAILWAMQAPVGLTDAATIAVDLGAGGENYAVTLGANRVLGNPTGGRPGQQGSIFVTQDATGGRVLSFGSNYVPDDLINYPQLNTAAGVVTELRYKVAADGIKVRIYGGKPSGGKRVQTLSAFYTSQLGQTYSDRYYTTQAETVTYAARTNNNPAKLAKWTADLSTYSVVADIPFAGVSGSVSLAAGESLSIVEGGNNSAFFAHIVQQ